MALAVFYCNYQMISNLANKEARELKELQKEIVAVASTERMLSKSDGNDQRPYLVCTVYLSVCTYVHAYMHTVLPNVYLYYYICYYYTTDVTMDMVSPTSPFSTLGWAEPFSTR